MPKYPFLSPEWVEEARRIYGRAQDIGPLVEGANLSPARVNLIVTDAPFSATAVQAHVEAGGGRLQIDSGHLEKPDVTVSMSYVTARSLFVAGDTQTVMQAFLGGRIRVDGDLSKLLDPRSGIWPAGLGASAMVPQPPTPGDGPSAGNEPAANASGGQQGLELGTTRAQDMAKQLQEITE